MTTSTPRCGALLALLLAAVPAAGLLAPDGTAPAGAAFPGANGKIAFSSDRAGDNEIFAMNPDGTGLEQFTSNDGSDYDPAWSADGGWMAFTGYEDGDAEIYARSCCGGDVFVIRGLTNNTASDEQPAWSPDGTKIAFVTDRESGDSEIYVMDATDEKNNQTGQPGPDGNGDNQRNLTTFPAIDTDPAWSPDGTKIAFARTVDGNTDVWVMNADGSGQKRLTRKAADDYDPVWSPDGKKIAFETARGGGSLQIYVMKARPEGKRNRPKNLTRTNGEAENLYPDWRPLVN